MIWTKAIQKNDFLSRLDDEQIAMMVDLLMSSNYKPSEEIIKEGLEGDSMYIVAEVFALFSWTLTKGDVFGELAILYNCKRTATVKAKTHVHLWLSLSSREVISCYNKQIRRMGKGEHFGEQALIRKCTLPCKEILSHTSFRKLTLQFLSSGYPFYISTHTCK
uniref:Cyclic nucleotide-binding domain-containing protein n=1 Tax=Poecilia latipinna TaxID=48699 RepID=A0A3B3VYC9_9TELE